MKEYTCLRDRQTGQFHELVDAKGTGAHKFFVQFGGILRPECLLSLKISGFKKYRTAPNVRGEPF